MWPLIIIPVAVAGIAYSVRSELKAIEDDFNEHERTDGRRGAKHALSERLYASPTEYSLSSDNTLQRRLGAAKARREKRMAEERAEQEQKEAAWQALLERNHAKVITK